MRKRTKTRCDKNELNIHTSIIYYIHFIKQIKLVQFSLLAYQQNELNIHTPTIYYLHFLKQIKLNSA